MSLRNMPRCKEIYLIGLLLAVSLSSMAQRTVSGKVSGNNNQPLAGATVTVKSTKNNTSTDDQGFFKLNASDNDVLVVTNVGYIKQEVKVPDAGNIVLQEDAKSMNEVVVIALGVKKEIKRLGYSVQE